MLKEKLFYLKYCMFHPFDGFYQTKVFHKGSVQLATAVLIIFGILQCVSYQYTGFIMNHNSLDYMNSFHIFMSSISLLLLCALGNWAVTTLFNGKGNFKDIYIVLCYSLLPIITVFGITVFASNFIITEEVMILQALKGMAIVWFIFIILSGLLVIHEYTFGTNLITVIVTFIAVAIIVFLGVLFVSLLEQMISFFVTFGQELIRRW